MEQLTDEELIERCQAKDGPASGEPFLNVLFQRHHRRVASWCYHMTGDTNSAVDLAQEIFIKAFQGIRSFRRGSKFTTWLYSIARNHCMDELRSRKRQVQETGTLTEDLEDWGVERADSVIEQRESRELMQKLIRDSLDETETKVMTLHYVHELPLDAVSRMLGLTNESGAKAHIVSARRKLKRAHEMLNDRTKAAKAGRHAE
jgi:RNA polymerase sigma-70 factor (ECF subfamily)